MLDAAHQIMEVQGTFFKQRNTKIIASVYQKEADDLVHHYRVATLKPNLEAVTRSAERQDGLATKRIRLQNVRDECKQVSAVGGAADVLQDNLTNIQRKAAHV